MMEFRVVVKYTGGESPYVWSLQRQPDSESQWLYVQDGFAQSVKQARHRAKLAKQEWLKKRQPVEVFSV